MRALSTFLYSCTRLQTLIIDPHIFFLILGTTTANIPPIMALGFSPDREGLDYPSLWDLLNDKLLTLPTLMPSIKKFRIFDHEYLDCNHIHFKTVKTLSSSLLKNYGISLEDCCGKLFHEYVQ